MNEDKNIKELKSPASGRVLDLRSGGGMSHIYFIGIGGIGMSAIARYFHSRGVKVSGYDRSSSSLTKELEAEGMHIHYEDDIEMAPKNADLIVYTPAIPASNAEPNLYENL